MDSNMKLKFGHPCNNCSDSKPIYKVRNIPLKAKSRQDFEMGHFVWNFTQWDYSFILEHYTDGNCKLLVSCNPSDPYDWQQVEDCTIIKDLSFYSYLCSVNKKQH